MKKTYNIERCESLYPNPWVFQISIYELHTIRGGIGNFHDIYANNLKVYSELIENEKDIEEQNGICDWECN